MESTKNETGYPLTLRIPYHIDMKTTFGDIRFTDLYDNPLEYNLINKTDSTFAWFEVYLNLTTLNTTNYYVYFGDNTLNDVSNETAVLELYDNFNTDKEGILWQDFDTGKCSYSGGKVDCYNSLAYSRLLTFQNFTSSSIGYEFEAVLNLGTSSAGNLEWLWFDFQDAANWGQVKRAGVGLTQILESGAGVLTSETGVQNLNEWYNVKIRRWDNNIDILFNDTSYSFNDTYTYANGGYVGFANYKGHIYGDWVKIKKYFEPEPIGLLYDLTQQLQLSFEFIPLIPNVLETVNFESTNSGLNITRYWWDFGDGTSIVSDTINTTSHIYSKGGTYTVNLTGLNETGNNISVSQLITVFEPTITIWAKDVINDIFIQNFTVTASNSTNTTIFTATGNTAVWNFTSGPYGNVGIVISDIELNHSKEIIQITNSINVNFTASVYPPIFIFRPRDVDYKNVIVPVSALMTNTTLTKEKLSSFEIISSNISTITDPGKISTPSNNFTGQMWKIEFDSNIASGTGVANTTIIFHSENGEVSEIIYFASGTFSNDLDITRYIYLKKDGTYKVLTEAQTVERSGNFAYFPAKLQSNTTISIGDGVTSSSTTKIYQPSFQLDFLQPDNALTGNVTVVFEQLTDGFFGFLGNRYDSNKVGYREVVETNLFTQTVYMLTTARSKEVKITIVDRGEGAISNTLVVVNIFVDDVWKVFASGFTDGTGIVKFNLDEDQIYLVTLSASGFSPQAFTITQPENEYKFYLSDQFQFFESPLDNLAISLTPTSTSIYTNTSYWFNYTVVDGDTQTDWIKLTLEDQNRSVLFTQTSSGNPTGGVITTYFQVTNQTKIYANMTVKRFGVDEITITRTYSIFTANITSIALSGILTDFRDANTEGGWSIITLIITMIASLVHPLLGIVWLVMLAFVGVLDIYILVAGIFAMIGGTLLTG